MRRNFFDDQAVVIHDGGARQIQADGQIANLKSFVRAERLLILECAAFSHQQIYEARSLGEEPRAVRAENMVDDRNVAGEGACVEESRQVSAVIDVQVRQQNRIHFVQVQVQFADAQERARPGVYQDARRAFDEDDETRSAW